MIQKNEQTYLVNIGNSKFTFTHEELKSLYSDLKPIFDVPELDTPAPQKRHGVISLSIDKAKLRSDALVKMLNNLPPKPKPITSSAKIRKWARETLTSPMPTKQYNQLMSDAGITEWYHNKFAGNITTRYQDKNPDNTGARHCWMIKLKTRGDK
jgi:hypothetical protein